MLHVTTLPEERVTKLEAEVDRLQIHARLSRLEQSADKPPSRGFVGWMGQALPQLITGVVLLVVGFWIKDSVDLAVKQQQLQLSYVKEMKDQLDAMAKKDADLQDVQRAAVLIATFGQPAVLPLMNEVRQGGNRTLGAEVGLRSLALMHPESVCDVVLRVVSNRARVLDWEAQMVSSRILAAAGCAKALPVLRKHKQALRAARDGKEDALSAIVREPPTLQQQKIWTESLEESIAILSPPGTRK